MLNCLTDEPGPPAEELHSPPAYLDGAGSAAMAPTALEQFLAHALGYPVSGSDLLGFSGCSAAGVRVTRIDHPGGYPGRYV